MGSLKIAPHCTFSNSDFSAWRIQSFSSLFPSSYNNCYVLRLLYNLCIFSTSNYQHEWNISGEITCTHLLGYIFPLNTLLTVQEEDKHSQLPLLDTGAPTCSRIFKTKGIKRRQLLRNRDTLERGLIFFLFLAFDRVRRLARCSVVSESLGYNL